MGSHGVADRQAPILVFHLVSIVMLAYALRVDCLGLRVQGLLRSPHRGHILRFWCLSNLSLLHFDNLVVCQGYFASFQETSLGK